jgi:putative glutamine amidotransferase
LYPGRPADFVIRDYSRAVETTGGLPVLIPVPLATRTGLETLARLDGLLLTGGDDVHPRCYGEEPLPALGEVDYQRDLAEIALVRAALESGLPVLGICRGLQLINVACGGTLYQDIFTQRPDCQGHRQSAPRDTNTHKVQVLETSRLHDVLGQTLVWVNSRHHQAVRDPAPGLTPSARAGDGLIEALEKPDHPFLLAVQWHPEGTWSHDEYSLKLFQALTGAAKSYRTSRPAGGL